VKDYNILYVDDERANLNSLKSLFRRKFNIITATSGLQGLELLEEHSIQLIIADQRMPLMTGIEFLKKVKEKWPDIKLILLTGYYDNQVVKEAVNEVGIYWYMNKPFENEKLELVIQKGLEAFKTIELLKDSEEKFKGVFNSMADVFIRRNMNGIGIMISPSVYDVMGYRPEEIIGQSVSKFFIDPKAPDEIMKSLLENKGVQTFESDIFKKDGSIITISSNSKVYFDVAGNPLGIESVFRDITEKKKVEKALKENEEKFKEVFNSLIDVFIRRDLDHKGVLTSPSIFEVTGYVVEDIVGQDISKYFVDPQKPGWIKQYLLANKGVQAIEFELFKKDGTIITISSNAKVYYDIDGKPIGIESVFRNITEKKKIAEELKESEQKFKTLVTNTEEIVYMIAKDGTFLLSEGKGLEKLGLKGGDVVGKSVYDLYKDFPEMLEKMRQAFNGEPVIVENKVGDNYFRNWYTPQLDQKGEIIGLMGLSINITEQKLAESKILEYQKRLKDLAIDLTITEEKMRKQIAIDLHDDVGQLLSASRMQMAAINYEAGTSEIKKKINSISQDLLRAIQSTRSVIFNLSPPQINEIGLYAAVHDWMKEQIENKHAIRTNLTGKNEHYPMEENTRFLIFRSLRELMINVVKHAKARHLNINIDKNNRILEITVQDDGVGYDSKSEFVKSNRQSYGLFSIQERMEDLGGSMKIDSKPGIGTKIKLLIPIGK